MQKKITTAIYSKFATYHNKANNRLLEPALSCTLPGLLTYLKAVAGGIEEPIDKTQRAAFSQGFYADTDIIERKANNMSVNMVILDIDVHVPGVMMDEVISSSPYEMLVFNSPSSTGGLTKWKMLIPLSKELTSLDGIYDKIALEVLGEIPIDSCTRDTSRLCYIPGLHSLANAKYKKGKPYNVDDFVSCLSLTASNPPQEDQPTKSTRYPSRDEAYKDPQIEDLEMEALYDKLMSFPDFQDLVQHPESQSEPSWFSALESIARHAPNPNAAIYIAHELSRRYPDYSEGETQGKIEQRLEYISDRKNSWSKGMFKEVVTKKVKKTDIQQSQVIEDFSRHTRYHVALALDENLGLIELDPTPDEWEVVEARAFRAIYEKDHASLLRPGDFYDLRDIKKPKKKNPAFIKAAIRDIPLKSELIIGAPKNTLYFNPATKTIIEANHCIQNTAPEYNEKIHKMLLQMPWPSEDWMMRYLHYFTDVNNYALPALHLHGATTSGKSMLALLLKSCFTAPLVVDNELFKNEQNTPLGSTSVIFLDEEIPQSKKRSMKPIDELKTLVTSKVNQGSNKYKAVYIVIGYHRIISTKNTAPGVAGLPLEDAKDLAAVLRRFQTMEFTKEHADYLENNEITGEVVTSWLADLTFAKHVAWIRANYNATPAHDIVVVTPVATKALSCDYVTSGPESDQIMLEAFITYTNQVGLSTGLDVDVPEDVFYLENKTTSLYRAIRKEANNSTRYSIKHINALLKRALPSIDVSFRAWDKTNKKKVYLTTFSKKEYISLCEKTGMSSLISSNLLPIEG